MKYCNNLWDHFLGFIMQVCNVHFSYKPRSGFRYAKARHWLLCKQTKKCFKILAPCNVIFVLFSQEMIFFWEIKYDFTCFSRDSIFETVVLR